MTGPIYITIGPQSSGKSTILSKLLQHPLNQESCNNEANLNSFLVSICNNNSTQEEEEEEERSKNKSEKTNETYQNNDVSIDDQEGTYIKVPIHLFLPDSPTRIATDKHTTSTDNNNNNITASTMINDTSVSDRIDSDPNNEMRWVIQRLCQKMSADEFQKCISNEIHSEANHDARIKMEEIVRWSGTRINTTTNQDSMDMASLWTKYIMQAVDACHAQNLQTNNDMVSEVDLYIFENMLNKSINAAKSQLQEFACNKNTVDPTMPISWGNTNVQPRDYTIALEASEQSGRPVYFIPYGDKEEMKISDGLFLPSVGLDELFKRNVQRVKETGRYVPSKAIIYTYFRVKQLMESVQAELVGSFVGNNASSTTTYTKFQLDSALAKLAGYHLNTNRTVKKLESHHEEKADHGRGSRIENGGKGRGRGRGGRSANRGGRSSGSHACNKETRN